MVSNGKRSRSVEPAIAVLCALAERHEPVGLSEIARRTTLPKSTVHLALQTMRDLGFVAHVLRTSIHEGSRMPLHGSASGKCLLAGLLDAEIDRLYPTDPLPESASRTIRARAELWGEIKRVRERGYATNSDEFVDGVTSAAVPVKLGARTVASLSLAGPTKRVRPEEWVDDLLAITRMPDPAAISTTDRRRQAVAAQETAS